MSNSKNRLFILFCTALLICTLGLFSHASAACSDIDGDGYGKPGDASCPKGVKTDCDDNDNKVYPGAAEICDGKDTNCDGYKPATDIDKDSDGVPMCKNDCNDNDPTVYPKAPELCDGKDNNCDYSIPVNERDLDADGYRTCGVPADCNDNDRYTNPGAQEWCSDNKDNNCNGQKDETPCICPDADNDGFTASYCGGTDCDDINNTIYPGAPELCTDGKDNDCNGLKDCADPNAVNCPVITDADGDGFDVAGLCGTADCDDSDPKVYPGAAEICDGKDSNCDGWKAPSDKDADGDKVPVCAGDCNDNNANINPLVLERHIGDPLCTDGLDNDCDGRADAADSGCSAGSCNTKTSPKDSPHFFTLLNPDGTIHPDNTDMNCLKCHAPDFNDPIRFACQRCHADPADASDPLNGTLKSQYPLAPPYGYGTAPNVSLHSSSVTGTKYGSWNMGDKGCVTCHNPHAQEQNNVFGTDYGMFIKEYICFNNPVTGLNIQEFVELTSDTGAGSFADGPKHNENVCEMCHTQTKYHRRDGSSPSHYDGDKCTSCHSHTGGFKASCLDCHSVSQGNRAAITSQFSSNSHHIQGVALDKTHCYQCHWEANSDGSINGNYHSGSAEPGAAVDLVIYGAGTRPGAYSTGITAVPYTANGSRTEIQKINAHCLGCHSSPNDATAPFGDGKTPKQYAYDNGSIDSRYSQTGSAPWGKYSGVNVTPKNMRTKAYSAHGNAVNNQGGWDLNETWPNKRNGTVNVACFDCHNSHGSNVNGTTTSYTSSTVSGGILKDTTQNKGGYSLTYKPQEGGASENNNAYNPGAGLCFDCHMNATAAATPWGYQQTFGAVQSIMGYWDTPYFGPGTAGSQSRHSYKAARTNRGGHFGASSELSTDPAKTIGGLCTPCHDPHGVSPLLGADMQYAVPLLKGTWLTSSYKEDTAPANNATQTYFSGVPYHIDQNTFSTDIASSVAPIAETEAQFAGLCLGCHSKTDLTDGANGGAWKSMDRIHESVKGWGANVKHNYSCSKCHVPHNSGLPRLMATNCLDPTHKGRMRYNASPLTSGASCGDYGCGNGRTPGDYSSFGDYSAGVHTVACHEDETGNSTDQGWNTVTPWVPNEPGPPVLTDEPNTGCVSSCSVTLLWNAAPVPDGDPAQYIIQVDDEPDFSSPDYTSAWTSGTSVTTTALNTDATYYWRVQARDSVHTNYESTWSAPDAFALTTPSSPQSPVLAAEPDYGCVSSCTVALQWYTVASPDGDSLEYRVQVDNVPDFSSPDYTSAWIPGTNATTTALPTGTTYYWRAQARDAAHTAFESAWSTVDIFALTAVLPPPAPALIDETNAGCASSCGVTLQWNAVTAPDGHAAQYLLQVDNASDFSSPNYTSTWTSGTSAWSTALSTNTTYYWRVKARDSNSFHITSESGWSGPDSFRLIKPPSAPALVDEPNIGCASSCSVTLEWGAAVSGDGDTVQYFVQVDDASDFSSPDYTAAWISGNSATTSALGANAAYYWRVKARDANPDHTVAESSWSNDTFQFMISNPPPAPAIISHGNYDSGCSDTAVTLQWDPVADPDGDPVQYYVSTDSYGDSGWLPAGQTSWSFTNYAGWGVTWKVKARDAAHTGSESAWSASEFFYDIGSSCWSGSCPLIFGWNGSEYKYITDIQGPVIGLPATALKKNTVLYQPSYIVMDGLVQHTDNNYWIKIRESLPEITYLDEAKLLVVDYPRGHQILTSSAENTYNYGYVNPFTIYTIKSPALPVSATDRDGNDVLASVLAVDNNPAPVTPNPPSPDFYTLDFGIVQNPENAKLLIDSWAFYGDSKFTANSTTQPSIEVLDQNGNWVKVRYFGTPAGDLKTMVISIPNIFISEDHRIRINMGLRKGSRWMIDRIRLDDSTPAAVTVREIEASAADLQMGGMAVQSMATLYSRIIASDVNWPLSPDALGYGKFTKYGDVGELLSTADDKYVIMRHGDRIDLSFPSPGPVLPGFARGFILEGNLYYKTFGVANTVEPLPFHGMSDYPYPEGEAYPADADHLQYLQIYNIREFTP